MGIVRVSCGSCAEAWTQAGGPTVYEREAIESRPCPSCGAYTLTSPDPAPPSGRGRRGNTPPDRRAA